MGPTGSGLRCKSSWVRSQPRLHCDLFSASQAKWIRYPQRCCPKPPDGQEGLCCVWSKLLSIDNLSCRPRSLRHAWYSAANLSVLPAPALPLSKALLHCVTSPVWHLWIPFPGHSKMSWSDLNTVQSERSSLGYFLWGSPWRLVFWLWVEFEV